MTRTSLFDLFYCFQATDSQNSVVFILRYILCDFYYKYWYKGFPKISIKNTVRSQNWLGIGNVMVSIISTGWLNKLISVKEIGFNCW